MTWESPQAGIPSKGILGSFGEETLGKSKSSMSPDGRQPVQKRRWLIVIVDMLSTPPHGSVLPESFTPVTSLFVHQCCWANPSWNSGVSTDPTGLGLSPTELPPLQTPAANGSPGHLHFCLAPSGSLERVTELRRTLYSGLQLSTEDTNEQPDGEVHRARSGRAPRAGASVPRSLCPQGVGVATLPTCGCVHHPEAPLVSWFQSFS